jgi:hemoglobin
MNDIQNQNDLSLLITLFYNKLLADKVVSYFFTETIKLNIENHIPIVVTFWSQAILGTGGYFNNLTNIHLEIDKISKISENHFDVWLNHFNETVDENFAGSKSEEIKVQAKNLSFILKLKINQNNS